MKELKTRFKSEKINAFFREITPIEYLLMCLPFLFSLVSIPAAISLLTDDELGILVFIFILVALSFTFILGILFLAGVKWRIIYFIILIIFGNVIILFLGKPWEYYLTAGRDSAIRVGIEAILQGKFPYYSKTYLGNYLTPLPFTFILYLPIYLITGGYTFYMNMIIFSCFCITLLYKFINTERDYLIIPIIAFIIFSDWFFLETATNSDLINTGLILGMSLFLLPDNITEQKKIMNFLKIFPIKARKIDKRIIVFATLFGFLLAMRILVWIIGIIILLYILKIYGLKNTFYLSLITISVFLVCILPFMLQDIHYFLTISPLGTNSRHFANWRPYNSIHPFGYIILDFLNKFLNYGRLNGIFIACIIIGISFLLGITKCENKLHLTIIISLVYILFLMFYLFSASYSIIMDYISLVGIPFIMSFLYIDFKKE